MKLILLILITIFANSALATSLHPATNSKCYQKAQNLFYAMSGVETYLQVAGSPQFLGYLEDTTTVGEGEIVAQENIIWEISEISSIKMSFVKKSCLLTNVSIEVGE